MRDKQPFSQVEGKHKHPCLTVSGQAALHHQHQHRAHGHKTPSQRPSQRPRPHPVPRRADGHHPRSTEEPCRRRGVGLFSVIYPSEPGATAGAAGEERMFGSHWSNQLILNGEHLRALLWRKASDQRAPGADKWGSALHEPAGGCGARRGRKKMSFFFFPFFKLCCFSF